MVFTVRDEDGARIQGHRDISDWSMYGGKGTRKVQLMTEGKISIFVGLCTAVPESHKARVDR
jgi:hypothetical protein